MQWIAPSEKDTDNAALEKRLWDAADQFRANSGLKALRAEVRGDIRAYLRELSRAASGRIRGNCLTRSAATHSNQSAGAECPVMPGQAGIQQEAVWTVSAPRNRVIAASWAP